MSYLVIIQFIVITKGAERVSEVAARFTLDAMPGKQMSIDADLNAGMISETEARARREKVSNEADFYGAMDGATKFVKGDAIAGIIIVIINLIVGMIIGVAQMGLTICRGCNQVFAINCRGWNRIPITSFAHLDCDWNCRNTCSI